jgi:WD40 repeat protein
MRSALIALCGGPPLLLIVAQLLGNHSPAAEPPREEARTRTDRHGDPIPEGARNRLGSVRLRQAAGFSSVCFTTDGKGLITGRAGPSLWEVATGKLLRRFGTYREQFNIVAVSPNGKMLAAGNTDGTIRLWSLDTGDELPPCRAEGKNWLLSVAFSPDGKVLASGGGDGWIRLHEAATGKALRRWRAHPGTVFSVAFSPDGTTLVSGGSPGNAICLWDVATGKEVRRIAGHEKDVISVAVSPDGKTLASRSWDQTVRLWEAATGRQIHKLAGDVGSWSYENVVFSPDGKTIASEGENGTPRIWEVVSGKEVFRSERPHSSCKVAFSPDGKVLASASFGGAVCLWDTSTGKALFSSGGHLRRVRQLAFVPDGTTVVSGSDDETIRFWDPVTARERRPFVDPSPVWIRDVSADGKTMAASNRDGCVHLWDLEAGKEGRRVRITPAPEGRIRRDPSPDSNSVVYNVLLSPDGKRMAVEVGLIHRLWDVVSDREICCFPEFVHPLAWSSDGKTLAATNGNEIQLWDAIRGRKLRALRNPANHVRCAALSPDGKLLVAGNDGPLGVETWLRLWHVPSGKELPPLGRHAEAVALVAFSPDSKTVASVTKDETTIRLWEAATGKERRQYCGHGGQVTALSWSPDGKTLASGSTDTTVLLWDFPGADGDRARAPGDPSQEEMEHWWKDLADANARTAYRALCSLVTVGDSTVAWVEKRLHPVPAPKGRRIAQLIRDLNDDRFATREEATEELEQRGEAAEAALRQALDSEPPPEVRRRIERILSRMEERMLPAGWPLSPDQLRQLRTVEVMEHLGSSEAQRVLRGLFQGDPDARLTQEAKASLDRLARRPVVKP